MDGVQLSQGYRATTGDSLFSTTKSPGVHGTQWRIQSLPDAVYQFGHPDYVPKSKEN